MKTTHPSVPSVLRTVALVLGVLVLAAGCDDGTPISLRDAVTGGSTALRTGAFEELGSSSIGSAGGSVEVNKPGHAMNGLRITVPASALSQTEQFRISSAPVLGHTFGEKFRPVTPVISIENGGSESSRMIRVRIPLTVPASTPVTAWYYDPENGTLDPIVTAERGAQYVEIGVRHFSMIVVSEFQKDYFLQGGGYASFFDPTLHGWSFENVGTSVCPGGICAGMSIGAAHVYKNFKATITLKPWFDNNRLWFATPTLWQDDADGLQFVTAAHKKFFIDRWVDRSELVNDYLDAPKTDNVWNLIHALVLLNQPQMLYIRVRNETNAHAIVAYGYTITPAQVQFKVYDPNYRDATGIITFDFAEGDFLPYTSSTNAGALRDGVTFNYNDICFLPTSTLCAPKEVDRLLALANNHRAGDGVFPKYRLEATDPSQPSRPAIVLTDIPSSGTYTIPYPIMTLSIVPVNTTQQFKLELVTKVAGSSTYRISDAAPVTLGAEETLLGVLVWARANATADWRWSGFHWLRLNHRSFWLEPAAVTGTTSAPVTFTARSNGSVGTNYAIVWNFGDGSPEITVTKDTIVRHTYTKTGDFDVTAILRDATGAKVAVARGTARIGIEDQINKTFTSHYGVPYDDGTPEVTITARGVVEAKGVVLERTEDGTPTFSYSFFFAAVPPTHWKMSVAFTLTFGKLKFRNNQNSDGQGRWTEFEIIPKKNSLVVQPYSNSHMSLFRNIAIDSAWSSVTVDFDLPTLDYAVIAFGVGFRYDIKQTRHNPDGSVYYTSTDTNNGWNFFNVETTFKP